MKKSRRKTSPLWSISKSEIQTSLDTFSTYNQILEHFNLNPYSGTRTTFMSRIKSEGYDLSRFEKNHRDYMKHLSKSKHNDTKLDLVDILVENSTYPRVHLKRQLIENHIIDNKCSECFVSGTWNNKPLSLQLDHINGVNNDNRIDNLRLLCPNCHSQTSTFSRRNIKVKHKCLNCGVKISKKYTRCKKCSCVENGIKSRKFEITKEELINLIKQHPMTKVGEILGVSDNAVRKRCRTLGIDYKNL